MADGWTAHCSKASSDSIGEGRIPGGANMSRVISALSAVLLLSVAAGLLSAQATWAQSDLPWMNASLTPAQRADLLLGAMTLDQKLQQIYNQPVYNEDLDVDGNPETEHPTRLDCDF